VSGLLGLSTSFGAGHVSAASTARLG
jgi:hypothetical protein